MTYALWIVQGLLAALFLLAGGVKLVLPLEELKGPVELPGPFLRFIGVAEVLGAIGLILPGLLRIRPGLTPLAAAGLAVIMIGATVVSLVGRELAAALLSVVVGLLAAFVAYGRWRLAPQRPRAPSGDSREAGRRGGIFGKVVVLLALIVVGLVVVVAIQPSEFRVARTATIIAPAPSVFAQVNDLHNWEAWSPWVKLDPGMKHTYEGAPAGTGAVYTWAGNSEVGEGRMTVTESRPSEVIRIRLEFLKPFPGSSTAEFTFRPAGDQTVVTWSLSGKNDFMAKAIHLVMNMDRMIGDNFEKGLARMKSLVEAANRR
jgi:hypothetical protein